MATIITDKAGLQNMSLNLAEDYVLGNDIDASGAAFTPVGTFGAEFTGTLDLAGYTISGLNMIVVGDECGLFGCTDGATISNGTLDGFAITGEIYVGALAGIMLNTVVSDIIVTNATIVGESWVGGVVGYADNSCTFDDCSVDGTVNSDSSGGAGLGGFVGLVEGTYTRCSANVTVTAATESEIGGFGGYCMDAVFDQSYALGDVVGDDFVGGFLGRIFGNNVVATADDCYARGNVTGNTNIGGFCSDESVWGTGAVTFTNCYHAGALAGLFVGGFIYSDSGRTTYVACFWDTEVSGESTSVGGTGKTTAQMNLIATFQAWDIALSSIDVNDGYPYLGWQEEESDTWLIYGLSPRTTAPVEDKITLETIRNVEMVAMGRFRVDKEGNAVYRSRYARNV